MHPRKMNAIALKDFGPAARALSGQVHHEGAKLDRTIETKGSLIFQSCEID